MASLRAPLGALTLHAPARIVPRAACSVRMLEGARRCVGSGKGWKTRQGSDPYAREAKLKGLKSRAAFKLLEVRLIFAFLIPGVFFRQWLTSERRWTQSTGCSRGGRLSSTWHVYP